MCFESFHLSCVDSLRWEVLPCETAGSGEGRGSDVAQQISRHGHTACLIEGCSQIIVFGGMRCSNGSGGGAADSTAALCDSEPLERNDLLLFDPEMLKWCASFPRLSSLCYDHRHHKKYAEKNPLLFPSPHAITLRLCRIIVPPSFGPAPPPPRISRCRLCRLIHGPLTPLRPPHLMHHPPLACRSYPAAVHQLPPSVMHGSACGVLVRHFAAI
jgi:hypothetical protein